MLRRKHLDLASCAIKLEGPRAATFEGYASKFNGLDSYGDSIIPGAFAKTIAQRKNPIVMLYGHSAAKPIGKWLSVAEDEHGLKVRGELTPGNTDSENVRALMRHGAISGLSIGYYPVAEEMKGDTRLLKEIELVEISVVSVPADDDARVDLATIKARADEVNTIADAEAFLRDAGGFSRNAAKLFLSQLKAVYLRDAGAESKAINDALRQQVIDLRARALLAGTI